MAAFNLRQSPVWWLLFLVALMPAIYFWGLFMVDPRALGVDALEVVLQQMGRWALWMLLITLACSTLKRRTALPNPVRFRRMLGLYAFFYATLHLGTYVIGWIELDAAVFWDDISKRPFIYLGMIGWVGLFTLAVTSPKAMVRKLKKNWKRLHRVIYGILLLAIIHFWMQSRVSSLEAWLYTLAASVLLGERAWVKLSARARSIRRSSAVNG
ncbi:sulfite oxidase heme-binding subunit YedZ [Saccharospirillum impatiens]|uniref:sulfite oxidase heme-binding subunit YedZ n=1 Tax=Saccharospirillum impatiens TaxID=169438 RepID=UPI0004288FDF|nr:protein-methionine-sulfoxide reductase heme-binding subunit MsrQ [Saccharospirillum impatiens]